MSQVVSVGQDLCVVDIQDGFCRLLTVYSDTGVPVWREVYRNEATCESSVRMRTLQPSQFSQKYHVFSIKNSASHKLTRQNSASIQKMKI